MVFMALSSLPLALNAGDVSLRASLYAGCVGFVGIYVHGKRETRIHAYEHVAENKLAIAADANGVRRLKVHPRCAHFRAEIASYRYDPQTGKPVKQFDHGPDEARMMCWKLRYE